MKKFSIIATIAATVMMMSGCKEEVDLTGTWMVAEIKGEPSPANGDMEYTPWLTFDEEGRIHGSGGVNIYNASYILDGNKLEIGSQMTTMMAGPRDVMDYERKLFNTINEIETAKVVDQNNIALCNAEGDTIILLTRMEKEPKL